METIEVLTGLDFWRQQPRDEFTKLTSEGKENSYNRKNNYTQYKIMLMSYEMIRVTRVSWLGACCHGIIPKRRGRKKIKLIRDS